MGIQSVRGKADGLETLFAPSSHKVLGRIDAASMAARGGEQGR
jgi:hypothetical protein